MSFRFRRSIKIAPGIRVNFNQNSTSLSLGSKVAKGTIGWATLEWIPFI